MRYMTGVATGVLLSSVLFSSCTCHQQVAEAPSLTERPAGFHASAPTRSPALRAQAPTATVPKQTPAPVAQSAPTPAVEMPADFPKDVPVFKDASLSQVQSLANNAHNVIFRTAAPVSEVAQFYQDSLTRAGWNVTQQFTRSNHAFATFRKGNMVANVTVAEDAQTPGQQVIAIMYEEQKPLDFDEF
jgi:hypothetical protein